MHNEVVHTEVYKGYTIEVYRDDDANSPADHGDTDLFLVADHRNFTVRTNGSMAEGSIDDYREAYRKTHHVLGLEAYIHGGVSLSLAAEGRFPDRRWDVSQLGAVFASKAVWKSKEKARNAALSLIEEWNQYLSGDVYGYRILEVETCATCGHGEPNEIESCYGFLGDYEAGALAEARIVVDSLVGQKEKAKSKKS